MVKTFGIRIVTKNDSYKFTFESTDMKARAKVYELAHADKDASVQLFRFDDKEGFEYVGSIDRASNFFIDKNSKKWIIDSRGKLSNWNSAMAFNYGIIINPSW